MLPEKAMEILEHESPVAIVTFSAEGPHLVGSWNSYVGVDGDTLTIPAGYLQQTEANLNADNRVQVQIASREVEGTHGPGAGFLIKGTADIEKEGPRFEQVKSRFSWARAALVVNVQECRETI